MSTYPGDFASPVTSPRTDSTGLTVTGAASLTIKVVSTGWTGTYTQSGNNTFLGRAFNETTGVTSNVFPNMSSWVINGGNAILINTSTAAQYTLTAPVTGTSSGFVWVTQPSGSDFSNSGVIFNDLSGFPGTLNMWGNENTPNYRSYVGIKKFPTSGTALIQMTTGAGQASLPNVQKIVYIVSGALTQTTPVNFKVQTETATYTFDSHLFGIWAEQDAGQVLTFTGNITRQDTNAAYGPPTYNFFLHGNNTGANTISGVISSAAGMQALSIQKGGTARWVLSGNNTYTGGTGISDGFLRVTNASALGALGSGTVNSTGGTIELSGGISLNKAFNITSNDPGFANKRGAIQSISGSNTIPSTASVAVNTLSCSVGADSGQTLTIAAAVNGNASEFITRGEGTVTLSNGNNGFSGAFYAAANVTNVANVNSTPIPGSIGTSTSAINLANYAAGQGGTLRYVGTVETSTTRGLRIVRDGASTTGYVYTLENAGTGTGYWRFNSGANGFIYRDPWANDLTLQFAGSPASGQTSYFNLSLTDPSGGGKLNLLKTGSGAWRIGATTANTGTTEVNAGTLIGDHDSATPSARFGGGNVRLNSGGTLKTLTGTSQLGRMSYASGLRLNGGTLQIGGT